MDNFQFHGHIHHFGITCIPESLDSVCCYNVPMYMYVMFISQSERMRCKITLTTLRESAKSLKEEYDTKEILRNQMRENYEKLRRGNKRYTIFI